MPKKQKILFEILSDLISRMVFPVTYTGLDDNGDGTFTISGICDIHHIQPLFSVTIGTDLFQVLDYAKTAAGFTVTLKQGSNSLPDTSGTFNLQVPYFFHGTPLEQETELAKIEDPSNKTPMIYLMEPYNTEVDYSIMSSIDRRCDVTLCFLTQANTAEWLTDDFYHNSIMPMYNLAQDFVDAMDQSQEFYMVKQRTSPKFYTKFGIKLIGFGGNRFLFSENLSGVGLDLRLEIYKDESCCTDSNFLESSGSQFIEVD